MDQAELNTCNKNAALPAGFIKHPVHFLALGLGAGCVPRIPGTAGTLVGVLVYYFLQPLHIYIYLAVISVMFLAGIWLCGKTAADLGVHDHTAIVWDEIVGYLITMILAPAGWMWMLAGFVLFRFFDICKPWPVSRVDRGLHGGSGIMLDDAFAAIYSLAILQITAYLI